MAHTTTERRERFQALIREAEALGKANPSAYRRRVILLALLGYAVLFGVLLLLLALLFGSVWAALASSALLILLLKKKLIFVLGYLIYAIARALWVKIEPPVGYELNLSRQPELAALLGDMRRQLDAPRIHRVVLTEDFNAGISQTPRLGVFGWPRNTLSLGLQLLLSLSPEQAKAVLAHEFGHLSGQHGHFSAWIYRVRQTWYRVMEAFEQSSNWGSRWLGNFFEWYAPHFNAVSFTLARANEYEADALSARLTSREAAASALLTTHVGGEFLGRAYWKPFIDLCDSQPRPAGGPFSGMASFLREQFHDPEVWSGDLGKALDVETDYTDTHPALKDRLAALNAAAEPPRPVLESAARAWLGANYAQVMADFDRAWLERNGEAWAERYRNAEEARTGLAALNAKPEDQLTRQECWQRASWSEQQGLDALPLYQLYAATYPEDRDADLVIGRLMLARDDAAGLTHIERAAEQFNLTTAACNVAREYFLRIGDREQAEAWLRRAEAQYDMENAARAERAGVTVKDELIDAGLNEEQLVELASRLNELGDIKHAWICRKAVKILPEEPVYVLAFQPKGLFPNEKKRIAALSENFRGYGLTFLVMKGGKAKKLATRVIKNGSKVL